MRGYRLFASLIFLLLAALATQPGAEPSAPYETTATSSAEQRVTTGSPLYRILSVADGDTFTIQYGTRKEKVRLIGIDTPEVHDPRTEVECFGEEASAHAKELLAGKEVSIETDPSQDAYDKYGRLLAYAYLPDGSNFNERMILDGYAYEYTYRLPYRFQKEFKAAEQDARDEGRGLWSIDTCNGKRAN